MDREARRSKTTFIEERRSDFCRNHRARPTHSDNECTLEVAFHFPHGRSHRDDANFRLRAVKRVAGWEFIVNIAMQPRRSNRDGYQAGLHALGRPGQKGGWTCRSGKLAVPCRNTARVAGNLRGPPFRLRSYAARQADGRLALHRG